MSDEDRAPQARGQKRKWPLQEQAPTVPDAPAVKRGHRWPVSIRMLATSLLNVSMGIQNYYTMVQTQVVPKDAEGEGVMRAAYQTVYAGVRDFMWIDGDCEGTVDREDWEANTMPSLKAVRQMAKKYALRSITDGSVLDEPPHLPDYKDEARKPYLEELVELLRLGYPDDNGEYRVYRTIEHACAINNQIMHLCFTSLGLCTYRRVWVALKKHCPAIYRGLLQSKKKRDKLKTQNCAKQVLGRQAVTFPSFYKTEDGAKRCFAPGYQYMWDPINGKQQWWIDAFTCDPRALGQQQKAILFKDSPAPVAMNDMLNASVGRLPVMLVYIAVHQHYGTRIFYPYHGAKAGKKSAYEGYEYWMQDLTEREVEHLNDILYYNQPTAFASARNAGCKSGAKFNPAYFRKKKGGVPEVMVSSELAAMFDLRVWPKLLECYKLPADQFTEAQIRENYDQQCKQFAKQIGRPWAEVHYPFFVSMDNCKKHPWLRKLMLEPRVSGGALQRVMQILAERMRKQRDSITYTQANLIALDIATRKGFVEHADVVVAGQIAEARAARGEYESLFSQWLADWQRKHGCTYEQSMMRDLAWRAPEFRTICPEQFMPLVECTPDIHAPVEHMVRTLKENTKERMLTVHTSLWIGLTYQQILNELVQTKGNGAYGQHHIAGSVRKQPLTCQILAAEVDQIVVLHHVFGGERAPGKKDSRTREWHVHGTAGGYIGIRKWT